MIEGLASAPTETWTRRIVTRAHLDTSILLLLQDAPRCSVNLLASAALDVLRGVLQDMGQASSVDYVLEVVPHDMKKEAIKLFKSPYNYAKHADKDPDYEFEIFMSFCELVMVLACNDYKAAFGKWSPRMMIFNYWFAANHDAWLRKLPTYGSIPKIDLFSEDRTPAYAIKIIAHVEPNPDFLPSLMKEVGVDWIEI